MKRIVILISGAGTNMSAIIQAAAREQWPARIVAVISNRAEAAGLQVAASHAIPTAVVSHVLYKTREEFDRELQTCIDSFEPDLVVLAGFLRIFTTPFVEHYAGRMINIHPSLLPSFTGLATHRQALEAGVKVHGATVHFVTPTLDHGPIIEQVAIRVLPNDTEQTLAARILEQEHIIYPRAVKWFIGDKLSIKNGRVECLEKDLK